MIKSDYYKWRFSLFLSEKHDYLCAPFADLIKSPMRAQLVSKVLNILKQDNVMANQQPK